MNKFIFTFSILIFSLSSFSYAETSLFLNENDTLNKIYFNNSAFNTYISPGGGYVSGNNAYNDQVKAQEFHAGNLCNIFAVIMNFGFKSFSSLNDSSYVGINFYHLNNTGRSTVSSSTPCPGNIFFRDSIKVGDIDTINGNVFNYINPVFTDSNFAIGIDFDQLLSSDTVALYTNKDGDAGLREQSWEQDASGNWFTLKYNWPLNVDFAIFPVVNTSTGINLLTTYIQTIAISPNPTENGLINVHHSTSKITAVQVYNSNLQLISSKILSSDGANTLVKFEASVKGMYFIKVKNEDSTINIQKVIVD